MDTELADLAGGIKALVVSTVQLKPSEGAFVDGDKTKLDGIITTLERDKLTAITSTGSGLIITAAERTAINSIGSVSITNAERTAIAANTAAHLKFTIVMNVGFHKSFWVLIFFWAEQSHPHCCLVSNPRYYYLAELVVFPSSPF